MLFLALPGARLPVFPTAHFAKVAKLALQGSNKATFTLNRREKQRHLTMSRLKTALVADCKTTQKVYRTLLEKCDINVKELQVLQETIGYNFSNPELLEQALAHLSYCNEQKHMTQSSSYERLEFLGDAVLEFLISEMVFLAFPDEREGGLTRLRTAWVNEKQLARMARLIDLGEYIRLGKGEIAQGGCQKDSILSDVYEALVAAIFLDGGIDAARKFVAFQFAGLFLGLPDDEDNQDYKSHLQEHLQQHNYPLPCYRLIHTDGPDHNRVFQVEVASGSAVLGVGTGSSKKRAEQLAAKEALSSLSTSLNYDC